MVSKFSLEKAEHMYYHLASASKKMQSRKEINSAIEESIKPRKKVVVEKRELTLKEKNKIAKLKRMIITINRRITGMKRSDKYDKKRLDMLQVKVKVLKSKILKIEKK